MRRKEERIKRQQEEKRDDGGEEKHITGWKYVASLIPHLYVLCVCIHIYLKVHMCCSQCFINFSWIVNAKYCCRAFLFHLQLQLIKPEPQPQAQGDVFPNCFLCRDPSMPCLPTHACIFEKFPFGSN